MEKQSLHTVMTDRQGGSLPLACGSSHSHAVGGFRGDSCGNLIPPLAQSPEKLLPSVKSESVS